MGLLGYHCVLTLLAVVFCYVVDHQHLLHQPQGSYSDGVMGEICNLQIGMIVILNI